MINLQGQGFQDVYFEALKDIWNTGDSIPEGRIGGFWEKLNYQFIMKNPRDRILWNGVRNVNYEFAMKFFIWMINGCTDYEYVGGVNPNAKNYLSDEQADPDAPKFTTAYGPRIQAQMEKVIEELTCNANTRRAVIMILDPEDQRILNTDTKEEYPCATSIQFMIRGNELHCIGNFRSCNFFTTICYDVFNVTMLHEFVFQSLKPCFKDLRLGYYHHTSSSAHVFFKDEDHISETIQSQYAPPMMLRHDPKPKISIPERGIIFKGLVEVGGKGDE